MLCVGIELLCKALLGAPFPFALVTGNIGNGIFSIHKVRRHGAEPQPAMRCKWREQEIIFVVGSY